MIVLRLQVELVNQDLNGNKAQTPCRVPCPLLPPSSRLPHFPRHLLSPCAPLHFPGFYQLSKLAITPVVVAIEWVVYHKTVSSRVLASIAILLVGITLCTVTDTQVSSNPAGIAAAVAAVLVASLYQVMGGCGSNCCLVKPLVKPCEL